MSVPSATEAGTITTAATKATSVDELTSLIALCTKEHELRKDQARKLAETVASIAHEIHSIGSLSSMLEQRLGYTPQPPLAALDGSPTVNDCLGILSSLNRVCTQYFPEGYFDRFRGMRDLFRHLLLLWKEQDMQTAWWNDDLSVTVPKAPEARNEFDYNPIHLPEFHKSLSSAQPNSFVLKQEFLPDMFIMKSLSQDRAGINKLIEENMRSERELRRKHSTLCRNWAADSFYVENPPFDVIKQTRLYQEYEASSNILTKQARANLIDTSRRQVSLSRKFLDLITLFGELDCNTSLSVDAVDQAIAREIELNVEHRKLLFYSNVVSDQRPFKQTKYDELVKKLEDADSGFAASDRTAESMQQYLQNMKSIEEEAKQLHSEVRQVVRKNDERFSALLMQHAPGPSADVTQKVQDVRDRINQLRTSIQDGMNAKNEVIQQMVTTLQNASNSLRKPSAFVRYFDSIARDLPMNKARRNYNESLISHYTHINSSKASNIQKMESDMELIKNELEVNSKKLEVGRENEKNGIIPKKQASAKTEEMRLMYVCPICQTNSRNVCLPCGHTFCQKCAESLIRKRNRHCPSCYIRIEKKSITPIIW